MDAARQIHAARAPFRGMDAVVVDDLVPIDFKPRAVVRNQREAIRARLFDPKPAAVIDGKPLEAFGNAGKPGLENSAAECSTTKCKWFPRA